MNYSLAYHVKLHYTEYVLISDLYMLYSYASILFFSDRILLYLLTLYSRVCLRYIN